MRIHSTMRKHGIDSHLMVSGLTGNIREKMDDVSLIVESQLLRRVDGIAKWIQYQLSLEDLFYPSVSMLKYRDRFRKADVVQLYSLHGGYFAFPEIAAISALKPVVWRMSDMWPFTGHCVYSGDCARWKAGCGDCPLFRQYPFTMKRDTTAMHWRLKDRVYSKSKLVFAAPSQWIQNLAKESPLIGRFPVEHVPNGVETDIFKPLPKEAVRQMWNLPLNAAIIMMSTSVFGDPRKGAKIVREVLEKIKASSREKNIHFLFYGRRHKPFEADLAGYFPMTATGYVEDKRLLASLYSAADLLLHPSIDENLANSVMESMACGTPVVCFDVGGMSDLIKDGETGYAVAAEDTDALAQRIGQCISDVSVLARMAASCREQIVDTFSAEKEAQKLVGIYEGLLNGKI